MMYHTKHKLYRFFIIFLIATTIAVVLTTFCKVCFGMGKSPLVKAQLAEQIKLADRVTGIENAQLKLADKLDGQVVAMAGLNNSVSKVSSEIKVSSGRDTTVNESQLMKDYIQAMKDGHKEVITVLWRIVWLLIIELAGIITAFGGYMFFTIKSLLRARDKNDIAEDKMLEKIMNKRAEVSLRSEAARSASDGAGNSAEKEGV